MCLSKVPEQHSLDMLSNKQSEMLLTKKRTKEVKDAGPATEELAAAEECGEGKRHNSAHGSANHVEA